MGHELAEENPGLCMQNISLYNTPAVWFLMAKRADHTWFSSPYLHACMPWGWGLSPPHVPPTHKFKERLIIL